MISNIIASTASITGLNFEQAIITACLTVFGSLFIFIFSEFMNMLFLTPIIKIREQKGLIIDRLIFYSDKILNPIKVQTGSDEYKELIDVKNHIRSGSSQLHAKSEVLPCYSFWSWLGIVPTKSEINTIITNLNGIQNCLIATSDERAHKFADDNLKRYNALNAVIQLIY